MTRNKRIALNFIATYGRSLYLLAVGLVCGRWKLQILGAVDFGLYGLVGGLTVLLSFLNSILADAVARFYAYSVGEAQRSDGEGIEVCRKWFSIAVVIHFVVPTAFLLPGYPAGVWLIENYLTIPEDRITDCIWVWRFVCASCFIGMVTVPYSAMYRAKQYIAELTIYSFVTATLNIFALYYMLVHPGKWLVGIAFWMSMLAIAPQVIIAWRAYALFPECRFMLEYVRLKGKFKELFSYAGYRLIGAVSSLTRGQLMAILVNKMLGPERNASMTTANVLNSNAMTFSASFEGALAPAITNAYGAGEMGRVEKLVIASCRLSSVMSLIFVLPLLCVADEVLELWLSTPPVGAATVCRWLMLCCVLQSATSGHYLLIYASGRIKRFEILSAVAGMVAFPVAYIFMRMGFDVASVGIGLFCALIFMVAPRIYCAKSVSYRLTFSRWLVQLLAPILSVCIVSLGCGLAVRSHVGGQLGRIVAATAATNLVFLPLAWFVCFNEEDRDRIIMPIFKLLIHR